MLHSELHPGSRYEIHSLFLSPFPGERRGARDEAYMATDTLDFSPSPI